MSEKLLGFCGACAVLCAMVSSCPANGQEAYGASSVQVQQLQVTGPDGKVQVITRPAGMSPPQPGSARPMPTKDGKPDPSATKKESGNNKGDAKKDGDKEKDGEKKEEEEKPKTIQRSEDPPEPADPKELQVKPDDDGKIQFSFRGQKWPDVLDFLARVSGMSLDWQELPNDYLNLTTQRSYTIDEARDLINRHLLSRGFTLLESGEVLSVAKTENIDPSMVPRVMPDQLAERRSHEFVKVSFTLDWLIAETAVEEFKPMLSPNGKLTALKTTNRIEAMDAVANLREVYEVLQHEQSDTGQERLFKEFILEFAKASDVVSQLESLLGLQKKTSSPAAMSRQQMEMMQQQQRMMAEMQKRSGQKSAPTARKQPEVHLVVNPRKNSILAKAPPDQMVIIEQAVKSIDVPADRLDSLISNPGRMQIYRLHAINPEPIVRTLEEIGELDPTTRLEVDEKNNAIIAFASLADHVIIRQLVERLDGSGRQFEVVQLRRLAADYVAGTVEFMMGGKEEEDSRRSRYDYYSSRYGRRDDSEEKDQFKVDADIDSNRLLLWANDIEIEEVMNLLVKLGELPPEGGGQSTLRVLDAIPADEAAAFLERLQRAWPSLAPNALQLPTIQRDQDSEEEAEEDAEETPAEKPPKTDPSIDARDTGLPATPRIVTTALFQSGDSSPESAPPGRAPPPPSATSAPPVEEATPPAASQTPSGPPRKVNPPGQEAPPPINLSIGTDGRIIITSRDVAALDLLEEVIDQLAPPPRDYEIFKLKYADAYWVKDNLEEYFQEDDDDDNDFRSRYFYGYSEPKSESRSRLSSRRKLKFIYDLDTNSILVQGADAQQLKTIEDLIEVYDQPEPTESQTARVSAMFSIKYSRASVIAEAIKDVYRDLLSSNDKALGQNPEQKNRSSGSVSYLFGMGGSDAPERTKATFKGKLSVGVDDVTNTLLVSAEGENLMQNITTMVETLDEAAKPVSSVSVVQLKGGVNAAHVRDVLSRVLAETGGKPATEAGKSDKKPNSPSVEKKARATSSTAVLSVSPR